MKCFAPAARALIAAALPAAAFAQAPSLRTAPPSDRVTRAQIITQLDADYAELDGNKDGKATRAEVEKRIATAAAAELAAVTQRRDEAFKKFDANNDGSISKAEFETGAPVPKVRPADAAPVLAKFDTNKDGSITVAEFRGPTLANFDRFDLNKDGTLTAAEQQQSAPAGR